MGFLVKLLQLEGRFAIGMDILDNIIDDLDNSKDLQKIFNVPVSRNLVIVAENNDLRIESAIDLSKEQKRTFLDILDKVIAKNSENSEVVAVKAKEQTTDIREGKRVFAKWIHDGYWYPATIKKIEGERIYVLFDDDDKEWTTSENIVAENIEIGDRVYGNWKGQGYYYPGRIAGRRGDRIYIQYDDGDREWTTIGRVRVER